MSKSKFGRYVVSETSLSGMTSFYFYVPPRFRPPDWPPRIALPQLGKRAGTLKDQSFVAKVMADGAILNAEFDRRRESRKTHQLLSSMTIPALAPIYYRSSRFKILSDARKYANRRYFELLEQWSEARGHPEVSMIRRSEWEGLLSHFDDRPSTRVQIRSIINVLYDIADSVVAGADGAPVQLDNPIKKIKFITPEPTSQPLWREQDVEDYAQVAIERGEFGLAAMLVVEWWIGQRLGDIRQVKHWRDEDAVEHMNDPLYYKAGTFYVRQGKTRQYIQVPVPMKVHNWIAQARSAGSNFVFNDTKDSTKAPFTAYSLSFRFTQLRLTVTRRGGRYLQAKRLRHSATVNMLKVGVDLIEVANVTGHEYSTVHFIMKRYAIRHDHFAESAMKQVNRASGGTDEDFNFMAAEPREDSYSEEMYSARRRRRVSKRLVSQGASVPPDRQQKVIGSL